MHIMKLPFYLGVLAALLGIVILRLELPKLHHYLQTVLLSDDCDYQIWLSSKESSRLTLERNVFRMLNYKEVDGMSSDKWRVLWSVEYPFHRHKAHIKDLQSHQRINHFPGMSSLTIKKHLATKFNSYDFIPNAFTFPSMKDAFEKFTAQHPEKRFVEKNWNNRGVKLVRNKDEINFQTLSTNEKFLQEFIENPYLIDNRMFDIGIYVLITSFDPLRVYRFNKEILLRFCAEDYLPFDQDNTKKFVVDDESIYVWDIPSLKDYVLKFNYTSKDALEIYMRQKGCDISKLWQKMDDIIVKLLLANERNVIAESQKFGKASTNFFEILRFDFILDADLNVHLMEINMSPNLSAFKDVSNIKRNYRSQLVYDALKIVGLTSSTQVEKRENSFIISDERDVMVEAAECYDENCNCSHEKKCMMCMPCISKEHQKYTHQFYREEHMRSGRMKRIFPIQKHHDENLISHISASNKFSIAWFYKKCKSSSEWCG